MIYSSFWEIERKYLIRTHVLLFFLYWELRHQMHNGYLNIRSGHEIEVAIRRFLKVPLKTFVALAEDFKIFLYRKQPFGD